MMEEVSLCSALIQSSLHQLQLLSTMKRVSLSILFLALLLLSSVAFARTLYENKNENNPNHEVDQAGHPACERICQYYWCCRAEDYAEFEKAHGLPPN